MRNLAATFSLSGLRDDTVKMLIASGLIVLIFLLGSFVVDSFFSVGQLLLTIRLAAFVALFGLCQMVVMTAGGAGLDLSVGFTATLTAVITAAVMDGQNANVYSAIALAVLFGLLIGTLNGVCVAYLRLPPLVVTLATANIVQGVINVYTAGRNVTGVPSPVLRVIAARNTAGIPHIVVLLAALVGLVWYLQNRTRIGPILLATGANPRTARLSGVKVRRVRAAAFVFSSLFASLVGLLLLGNMGIAFKDMGSHYVMPSIAAAVVGGVALKGGAANYLGVVVGAVLLQTLTNLLVALGWGDAGKWLGFGIVLYALLLLYVSDRRRR
jgi:ribose transport system permease protein